MAMQLDTIRATADRVAASHGLDLVDLEFTGGAKHVKVNGVLLTPLAVTKDNLDVIVGKGWITKDEVCAGVKPGTVKFCG